MTARLSETRPLVILMMTAVLLFVPSGLVKAFSGKNHGTATAPALAGRASADAAQAITNANKAVDEGPYVGAEHFDRNPGQTDSQAFQNGAAALRARTSAAIDTIKACHTETALKLIGEALHILQDFYSHSSYVDLSDADQAAAKAALKNPALPVPAGVKCTGYNPNGTGTGKYNPEGDTYAHGLYWGHHKDTPNTGDGNREITKNGVTKTAYTWAMEAAQQASTQLIDDIIAAVGQELWNQKFANYAFTPKAAGTPRVPIPLWWPFGFYFSPIFDFGWYSTGLFGILTSGGGILDDFVAAAVFVPENAVRSDCYIYAVQVPLNKIPVDWSPSQLRPVKTEEIMLEGADLSLSLTVGITYELSELGTLRQSDLGIYEFDLYNNASWSPVPVLEHDLATRTIYFETDHDGVFCIGGNEQTSDIPTLSTWGIIALIGLMILAAFCILRRRGVAPF